jgi:predicted  nucleic acid-binding Zn-ribbon protein
MSTANVKTKSHLARIPDLDQQIAQAKAVLRQLRDTLEDLDDRRDLARAKKENAGKPGTDWQTVKKQFGFEF